MAAVATSRREHARRPLPRRQARRLFEPGRPTLEDRIVASWQALVATGSVDCPVCGAEVAAGRECGACGSELS